LVLPSSATCIMRAQSRPQRSCSQEPVTTRQKSLRIGGSRRTRSTGSIIDGDGDTHSMTSARLSEPPRWRISLQMCLRSAIYMPICRASFISLRRMRSRTPKSITRLPYDHSQRQRRRYASKRVSITSPYPRLRDEVASGSWSRLPDRATLAVQPAGDRIFEQTQLVSFQRLIVTALQQYRPVLYVPGLSMLTPPARRYAAARPWAGQAKHRLRHVVSALVEARARNCRPEFSGSRLLQTPASRESR
jgi:hypothetical protein